MLNDATGKSNEGFRAFTGKCSKITTKVAGGHMHCLEVKPPSIRAGESAVRVGAKNDKGESERHGMFPGKEGGGAKVRKEVGWG